MRDFLELTGIILAVFVAAFIAVALLFIPVSYIDSNACDRRESIQGVETEYHWSTGCVYVDPDYVVAE